MKKVCIYFDGSNFYNLLKKVGLMGSGGRFDFNAFVSSLLEKDETLVSKRYYVGTVRNHDNSARGAKLVKSQQKFLSGIEQDGFVIKRGRIVYDHTIREKGVDVKIAIDMVIGASDGIYDKAYLVSADTDLIPAIRYAKSKAKEIVYVGSANFPSLGLVKESTPKLLSKAEFQSFLK